MLILFFHWLLVYEVWELYIILIGASFLRDKFLVFAVEVSLRIIGCLVPLEWLLLGVDFGELVLIIVIGSFQISTTVIQR